MTNDDVHLSDAELIRISDGEAGRDARRMENHLTACWQCRGRRMDLERTIADYVRLHREGSGKLPRMDESGARLLAALVQLSAAPVRVPPRPSYGRAAYGLVVASLVVAVGLVLYFSAFNVGAAPVPNQELTPGAIRTVTREDICSPGVADDFYPIPGPMASTVFESYRIANPRPRSYEVDYLITPALGGAGDIRNLWPQPYASGVWNAHVKDALEAHLHHMVCAGKLELEIAQRDIAGNWINAYRKYFNTAEPLPDHVAFSIDPPWER
ncbi:MAG TPA: hypothetical protein VFR18_04025 [Terriglobia bacterium]|nr:hypothetical protein [Terriglobia bacterium]